MRIGNPSTDTKSKETTTYRYPMVRAFFMYILPTGLALIILGITWATLNATQDNCDSPIHTSTTLITNQQSAVKFNTGRVNLLKPVAVGASFTAGYMSGALSDNSQKQGFALQMVKQFAQATVGEGHVRPLSYDMVNSSGAMEIVTTTGTKIRVAENIMTSINPDMSSVERSPDSRVHTIDPTNPVTCTLLGTPGLPLRDMVDISVKDITSPNFNPHSTRCGDPLNTVMEDAMALAGDATFFISATDLFGNDVLGYALSGGMGNVRTIGDTTQATKADLTHPSTIQAHIKMLTKPFIDNKAHGVLSSLPDISLLPIFNLIKFDYFTLFLMNAQINVFGQQIKFFDPFDNTISKNFTLFLGMGFPIVQTNSISNVTGIELANGADLFVTLIAAPEIATLVACLAVNTTCAALSNAAVLDDIETSQVKLASQTYSALVQMHATENDWAYVDLNIQFQRFWSDGGLVVDSIVYKEGDLFSLDGIHVNPLGAAAIANFLLIEIDNHYGTNFVGSGNLINLRTMTKFVPIVSSLRQFEASTYYKDAAPYPATNFRLATLIKTVVE